MATEQVETSGESPQGILRQSSSPAHPHPENITWDEITIAEHDKERGTRMKIDEPATPYYRGDSGALSEEEEARSTLGDALPPAAVSPEPAVGTNGTRHLDPDAAAFVDFHPPRAPPHSDSLSDQQLSLGSGIFVSELVSRLQGLQDEQEKRDEGQRLREEHRRLMKERHTSRSVSLSSDPDALTRNGSGEADSLPVDEEERRRQHFEKKRKAHYNEFRMLQLLRRSGTFDDEDEDEERDSTKKKKEDNKEAEK